MIQRVLDFVNREWLSLLWPFGLFFGVLMVGFAVRRVLFPRLRRLAAATTTQIDDMLVEALHGPFMLWVAILGIHLATELSKLPREFTRYSGKTLLSLWIISLTAVLVRFTQRLVRTSRAGSMPVGTLTQTIASLLIWVLGLVAVLGVFDISIIPVLGALGVGGIAVALALQDTLSNFFAGFYINLARQIRIGDFVKLDSGQDGYVVDIGWRCTTLRALANNLVVIPNNKLAQSIVINFSLPERRTGVALTIGVGYQSDPNQVKRVLVEVAQELAKEMPQLLADPPPTAAFAPGFGESSLDFTVAFQVAEYKEQFAILNALRERILTRFRVEGIEIPYPTRSVEIRRDSTEKITS